MPEKDLTNEERERLKFEYEVAVKKMDGQNRAKRWDRIASKVMIISGAVMLAANIIAFNGVGVVIGVAAVAIGAVKLIK